jgi:hypothetical protein
MPACEYRQTIERQTYAIRFYTMILAAIILINPTTNILLMLKLIIDPASAEAGGPSWLPDGRSNPPVVAGGRADGLTDVAGDLVVTVAAGLGDEVAGKGGLETGVATGAPAPTAADMHWLSVGVEILQAPGRLRPRFWLIGIPKGMLLIGIPMGLLVVVRSWQTQTELLSTAEARAVQQPCVGLLLLPPPCKNPKHAVKVAREVPHEDDEE